MRNLSLNWGTGLTLVFTSLVILFLVDSYSLSKVAGWVPRTTLAITLLLLVMQLLKEFRSGLRHQEHAEEFRPEDADGVKGNGHGKATTLVFLRISALVPVVWLFGISAGTAAFCLVYLRWHAEETWKFSIVFSFAQGLILYFGFTVLLQITLYPGVIFRVLA